MMPSPLSPFDVGRVVFRNRDIPIVGNVRVPTRIATGRGHPAIVLVTPGPCLKKRVGDDYASLLAQEGYVALTFDPSHQGESGGRPRDLEHFATRIEDIGCAIDFLSTLPFVDGERIAVLGIGAGSVYAEEAARLDRRIRAVGRTGDQPDTTDAEPAGRPRPQGGTIAVGSGGWAARPGRSTSAGSFAVGERAAPCDLSSDHRRIERSVERLSAFYRERLAS